MKKLLRHSLWWAVRFPIGILLGLLIGIIGSMGVFLVKWADTIEDIASHWRQGFVPPWLDDIKQDSTLYTQEWRKRVEDKFDR